MPPLCILPDNPYLSKNLIAFTFLAGPTHIKSFYFIFVLKSARKPKSLTKLRIFFFFFFFFWGGGGGGGGVVELFLSTKNNYFFSYGEALFTENFQKHPFINFYHSI